MNPSNHLPTRSIPPFWSIPGRFAAYPFRGASLTMLIGLSLAQVLTLTAFIGWIIGLLLLGAAYKYAFTILRETAHGRLDPPGGALDAPDSLLLQFVVVQLLGIAAVMLTAVLVSPAASLWVLLCFALIQPGITLSLAMDESLAAALNPITWLALLSRLGWPYLALAVLLFAFQFSAAWAAGALTGALPGLLAEVVSQAWFLWGLFATFHVMGYVLYQYHEALGFEPRAHVFDAQRPKGRDQQLIVDAEQLIDAGDAQAALGLLREASRERALGFDVHDLYRRLLREHGSADERLSHGRQLVKQMMIEGQIRPALGLLRECLDLDPAFAPMQPEHGTQLAEQASLMGQSALASDLLAALRAAYPKDPLRPHWALLEAQVLIERLGRDADARAVLNAALPLCEDADLRARLEALLLAIPADGGR